MEVLTQKVPYEEKDERSENLEFQAERRANSVLETAVPGLLWEGVDTGEMGERADGDPGQAGLLLSQNFDLYCECDGRPCGWASSKAQYHDLHI